MEKTEISIGRSKLNDLVIQHKEVSNFHGKLVFLPDGSLWIYDMDSTNGVFVNGKRVIDKYQIKPGDQIRLGSYELNWQDALLQGEEGRSEEAVGAGGQAGPHSAGSDFLKWVTGIAAVTVLGAVMYSTGILEKLLETSMVLIEEVENSWKLKNKEIVYDISCLVEDTQGGKLIKVIGDTKKEILGTGEIEIDIKEEKEVGLAVKKQIDKEYKYSKDPEYLDRISKIFSKIMDQMDGPRFDYEWHVVESETINAFTAGGQIFIFTGIIDFAQSDDEIACILGHEIYHNELGHIADKLKEMKIARNWLGPGFGDVAYYVTSLLTTSFNQENEVYSDLHGLDLAVKAGYNGCAGIAFWERMHEKEAPTTRTLFDKFMRSHPYSDERVTCNRNHIDLNYYHQCN
jgi:beta-barrel assembly-enhancing protease